MRNRELFDRLKAICPSVRVHRPGESGEFGKGLIPGSYNRFRLEKKGEQVGEEFSINCPLCHDTRHRLYLNHLYGTRDQYTGKRITWLVHCYNEECQSDWQERIKLANYIFDEDHECIAISPDVEVEGRQKQEVCLPGALQDLAVLAKQDIRHPAVQWCLARGLSISELSKGYGVGFCVLASPSQPRAVNRLVAPFYFRSGGKEKLAGWTARQIYDDPDQPKWLHSRSATGEIVYGLSEAGLGGIIVVVEGPGDKWAVGPPGVAILGKTLTPSKAKRIADVANANNATCIVLLDPDMDAVQKAKGKQHHSVLAAKQLRVFCKQPVLDIRLPSGSDPGSLSREYIWNYIYREARAKGHKLSMA